MEIIHEKTGIRVLAPDSTRAPDVDHLRVLLDAYAVYRERNDDRGDVWRRSGLKGQVFQMFSMAERAFWTLFRIGKTPKEDHLRDTINYAVFGLRIMRETQAEMVRQPQTSERKMANGEWPW